MIDKKELIEIGKFFKTHALKGELNTQLDISPDFFEEGNPLIVEYDGIPVPFFISTIRPKGKSTYLIKIDGVDSETEARVFVNKIIYAIKTEAINFMEELDIPIPNEFDGYEIIDSESGNKIGKVVDLDDSTQNVLFIVEDELGDTVMIPASDDFIIEIDDENKKITMKLPEGLVEINRKNE